VLQRLINSLATSKQHHGNVIATSLQRVATPNQRAYNIIKSVLKEFPYTTSTLIILFLLKLKFIWKYLVINSKFTNDITSYKQ
jgi:hypothetical protein